MLVLARRQQEQIRIGNDITITILRVKGQTVRVGIEAPREIHVLRGELPDRESPDGSSEVATDEDAASDSTDPHPAESRTTAGSFSDRELSAMAAV